MKQRPTMAGLKMFRPNPPKAIFPSPTPKAMPTAHIQRGIVGGRERAKIMELTKTADVTGFPDLKVKRASVRMPTARK